MTSSNPSEASAKLLALLQSKLGNQIADSEISLGDVVVRINRERMTDFFKLLKLDTELSFNLLIDITVVDWLDSRDDRFEVVYHFMSIQHGHRLRIKISAPESDPKVASIVSLWSGANFMEREAWDMYGVTFEGHPDLRRILMYDEFIGHPLRKDYPVQGKQPRVELIHPEVRNTAVDMQRPALVQINRRKDSDGDSSPAAPAGRSA